MEHDTRADIREFHSPPAAWAAEHSSARHPVVRRRCVTTEYITLIQRYFHRNRDCIVIPTVKAAEHKRRGHALRFARQLQKHVK
jgi:hypothetical protein